MTITERIVYAAQDGSAFYSRAQAEAHEHKIEECERALGLLADAEPFKDGMRSGAGYVQQKRWRVEACKRILVVLLDEEFPYLKVLEWEAQSPWGMAGRAASEGSKPLALAWSRLARIDEQGREWEQPYFAMNPPSNAAQLNPEFPDVSV